MYSRKSFALIILGFLTIASVTLPSCKKEKENSVPGMHHEDAAFTDNDPKAVKGKLKSKSSQAAISGGAVVLTNPSSSGTIGPVYSDSNGDFEFASVASGSYNIEITAAGYITIQDTVYISPLGEFADLGIYEMDEDTENTEGR